MTGPLASCIALLMLLTPAAAIAAPAETPAADIQAPPAPPGIPLPDSLPAPGSPAPGTDAASTEEQNAKESLDSLHSWATSIMFSLSDLRKLKDVLETLGHGGGSFSPSPQPGLTGDEPADAASAEAAQGEMEPQEATAPAPMPGSDTPAYYLSSILYKSPSEWSVWLNGAPFDPASAPPYLRLEEVTKKYVRFVWTPPSLHALIPRWQDSFKNLPPTVKVNSAAGTVSFTLQPNQSFVGRSLEIIEGRSLDAVPIQAADPASTMAPEHPQAPEPDEDAPPVAPAGDPAATPSGPPS